MRIYKRRNTYHFLLVNKLHAVKGLPPLVITLITALVGMANKINVGKYITLYSSIQTMGVSVWFF